MNCTPVSAAFRSTLGGERGRWEERGREREEREERRGREGKMINLASTLILITCD